LLKFTNAPVAPVSRQVLTNETGETVARKTNETVNGTGEKATETTRKMHHKSNKTSSKAKAQTTEEQATGHDSNAPAASPAP